MPRTARAIAVLCFAGFVVLFLNSHPGEPIAETTPEPDEIERGIWLGYAFLLWLAMSAAAVCHGFCELFTSDGFRLRPGPLITMSLATPGILYLFYALIVDART